MVCANLLAAGTKHAIEFIHVYEVLLLQELQLFKQSTDLPCDNHVILLFSMAHLAPLLELHNSSQNANPIAIKTHSSLSVPTHLS
jgi:hypothetical protein